MKKRTLVCFLIFTLCVFHFSITDTVFGQDATPEELAQQVFDEFSSTLTDDTVISGDVTVQDVIIGILNVLSSPTVLENPLLEAIGGLEGALDTVLNNPDYLSLIWSQIPQAELDKLPTQDVNDYIALLRMASVQTMLKNATVRTLIQNSEAVKLLLAKIAAAGDQEPPPKPDPASPTISITTQRPTTARQGSFNVAFTTADVNGDDVTVTASISVVPATAAEYYSETLANGSVRITQTAPSDAMPTIPGATVTLTLVASDGQADTADTTATFVVEFAEVMQTTQPPEPPEPPVVPSNLNGQSRLGGLSLNPIYGRGFIEDFITSAGLTIDPNAPNDLVAEAVDFVLNQIPDGFLPEAQIRQIRSALTTRQPFSVFQNEPPQLDGENFGNAITPALTDLLYTNVNPEKKYLASDNMNVYVRVPNALTRGSVQFKLNGADVAQGKRISPREFQADTIPYTFKLEETLAAINLPAMTAVAPDFPKIFKEVVLRYSQEGLDGEYISLQMEPYDEAKGVVWKGDVGIIPGRNVFYYFEVTLNEPVMLDIINLVAFGEAIADGFGRHTQDNTTNSYRIESWAMPDPRNLQFQDRGIIDALLTPDVALELGRLYLLAQGGNQIPFSEFNKLTQLLGRNVGGLLTEFGGNEEVEGNFDPKLASVFTVPKIDDATESLWVANIPVTERQHNFEAVVRNANGDAVDRIAVNFIGDNSAPEAAITFTPVANADVNTRGYLNKDGTFVSTDKDGGPAALLDIGSVLTKGILGRDDGYLLYQVAGLDKDGTPITTWLPLTVESSTMLASDIWGIAREQLENHPLLTNLPESERVLVETILSFPSIHSVLPLITPGLIQQYGDPVLASLGIRPIDPARSQFIVDLLGALVADIDRIPFTFDAERKMRMAFMPKEDGSPGEYGLRALGIDNLLNISSHIGATRLRIVKPEYDSSSIALASLGDINFNGKVDEYEKNTIYANARDLTLTIQVGERSGAENHGIAHPGTITVQYKNANDDWVTIGDPIELVEAGHPVGTTFQHPWTVTDFDDLLEAGNSVELRTLTWNRLDLEKESPDVDITTPEVDYFTVQLDDDVHPVDPKVLVVDLNDDSIVMTNPDSGAPQGMIELIAYTPRRTVPATASIRVQAKRMKDDWENASDIGTVTLTDPAGMSGTDTAAITFNGTALADVYVDDMLHIQDSGSYLKWVITVDTTALADTIEMDNLAAAHAASNPDGTSYAELDTNRYMVRAYAVGDDGTDISDAVEGTDYTDMFSVDNVDDVSPLGQNIITVAQDGVDVTPNEDGSFNVGGLVDKYTSDSPVITLTITPGAKRDTYQIVNLYDSLPDGAIISEVTETSNIGEFEVTIDVGTLMNDDGLVYTTGYLEDEYHENPDELVYNPKSKIFSFTVHALTQDATGNEQGADDYLEDGEILNADLSITTPYEITVNVQNTYRPDPGVLAIAVINSDGMVNPDSGAPQGILTFDVYTYGITSAPTEGIRVEVKRPNDPTWERITGTAAASEIVNVSEVPVTDLSNILTDPANAGISNMGVIEALVGISETAGESPATLMKWSYIVDTRELALEDTEGKEGAIKLDDTINRGDGDSERDVAEDKNQYVARAFALTPQNKNHYDADADYYPHLQYPENHDMYRDRGGVEAHFSLDNDDDVPPLGPTNITAVSDRDAYGEMQSIEANDDGSYTVGGIADEDGVASPVAIFHIQPTAEEITYAGGSLQLVRTNPDGTEAEPAAGSLEDGYIEVDVGVLPNGTYMYHALTVDKEGNVQVQGELDKPSPVITVHVRNLRLSDITDITVTSVDGESPDRHPLQDGRYPLKESIAVSFNVNDTSYLAVEDLTGVLVNGMEATFTAGSDAENAFSLMADKLSDFNDGWYTPEGRVTKRNGSATFALAMINLDNTGPMITIGTPTEGATVNDLPTLSADFGDGEMGSGVSDGSGVSATDTAVVTLDRLRPEEVVQDAVPIAVDQNRVEQDLDSVVYTRTDKLAGGAYQFTVQVSDILGNVGTSTVMFAIEGEDPLVVITAPASGQTLDHSVEEITGFFTGGGNVEITEFTINGESVEPMVTDNEFTYTLPEKDDNADGALDDGEYTVAVEVTDGSDLTAKTSLTFTVVLPVPTVAIHSPHAGQMYDHGKPIIAGDFSGADPVEVALSIDGVAVEATVNDNNQFTYTPSDDLSDGTHTVMVVVTDANGRTAQTSTDFTINIPGPTVMIHVPAAGQIYDISKPVISGEFSGVATPVTLSLTLDGEPVEAEISDNGFTYMPADALDDGEFTLVAVATDDNGKTAKATSIFSIRLPVPTVSIDSPVAGGTYDHTYRHISGEFTGVNPVTVALMVDGMAVEAMVDGNEFTYDLSDKLAEGEHMVSVEITDANGNTAQASTTFSVVYPEASVSIDSPVAGGIYDHTYRHISGEFMGVGAVAVSLSVDGTAVDAMVDGNEFTYDLSDKLAEGEHTVSVSVTDENGETAQASTTFSVVYPEASVMISAPIAGDTYDHTYRHITGEFTGVGAVAVSLSVDGTAVEAMVDGNEFTYDLSDKLAEGEHTVSVSVTDANGETAQASTTFSVVYPEASVMISSPVAGDTYDHTYRHITGEFTGVGAVAVSIMLDGTAVDADSVSVEGNEFTYMLSDKLAEGDHMVSVSVEDANGETAQATTIFSVVYPEASVMISSPVAGDTYDHTYRHISGEFMGVGAVAVSLSVDGMAVEAMVDGNEFTYDLSDKLDEGEHTVSVSVTDENGETAQASTTFSVVYPEASVSIDSPVAGGIYDHTYRHISGEFMGVGAVAVSLSVDGTAVDAMVDGNEFTFDLSDKLDEGEHTVSVSVEDANGETAQASTTFSVVYPEASVTIDSPVAGGVYDHTYRHISGEFMGVGAVAVSLSVDGTAVDAMVDGNEFIFDLSDKLDEGEHTVSVSVEDANGETAQASTTFSVVYPEASVTIDSPASGHTYDHTFAHIAGRFTGVGEVKVDLTVDGATVATQMVGDNGFTAESPELAHGEHTVSVVVTDANGETARADTTFTVDVPGPSVAILSPASGQTYDHGEPVIRIEYSGVVDVNVTTLTVDGADVEGVETEDNALEFTPSTMLASGEHTVFVEVTDANEKTAKATVVFNVIYDTTPPVISEVSPSGVLQLSAADVINEQYGVTISAIVTDEQSDITRIEYAISEGSLRPHPDDEQYQAYPVDRADGKFEVSESFDLGTHQVSLRVESEGGVREFRWQFTLESDTAAPTITSITPSGTIHAGMPPISASAVDNSAVSAMTIVVMDSDGEAVAGETTDDGDDIRLNQGVTRVDFHPEAPLSEGTYTIEVRATDTYNNSSTATGVFTVDFDTAAPIITSYSPQNGARLIYKHNEVAKPTIAITYGDAETGVNVDSVRLSIEGPGVDQVINLTDEQKSASQVVYTPSEGFTEPGQYTVILEVSDNAHQQGNVSEDSDDARQANQVVHKFSFFVEYTDAPVLMAPFNYPNPFAENTRISFGLNQMSVVSIVIYDSTLRPVRVLLDNKLMPAGKHTGGNGIGWDGKTSSGESLARGIYYAQIVVTGGFEAEYAILTLALTGAK